MEVIYNKYIKGDRVIWSIVLLLSILSLLAVYSSSGTLAYKMKSGDTEYYLFKHFRIIILGLILMYVTHRIKYTYYSRLSQILIFIAVPMLGITLSMGTSLNEASRWLTLPGTSLT